ncbi:MAG: hypothetical protein A2076_11110 [Geobacteraceae bacterium GWC2_53_11]|nr:MAG: hypothetical protein A2076_11110 [Geobacteraceae bacterium GWC2_53_11]
MTSGPPIPDYKRVFSFGVRKGNAELVEKLNQGLLIVKTDGTYEQIYRRWLTVEDPWSKWLPYFKVVVVGLLVLAGLVVVLQWLVRRRTRELKRATVAMEAEVAERRHAQAALQQLNATLEQRVAERTAEVRESEERMQQALRISRSFTFEWHPATEKVLRPESCGSILGLTGNEAVNDTGQNYFHRVHPDDRARFEQMLRDLTPAAANYAVEYRVTRPDGSAVVLEEVGQASFDSTGKLERLTGVSTDITARKQAEENLHKSTADLKAANATLRVSRAAAMNLMKDAVEARQAAEQAENELQKANNELELRVAERTRELEKTLQDLQIETVDRIQAVEILREKEQMLIQQSRQAAMGEMIGNIAHQWRQPLNTLGLFTQRLGLFYGTPRFNKEFLDSSTAKSMEIIQHMSKTIDDFRDYFKPEKDKSNFYVIEAIKSTLSLLESNFHNPKIAIDFVERGNPVINGYQNEYAQVILNILNNARDAVIERGVSDPRITITICCEDSRAVVTVTDNAGGIPDEVINKVFDPYFTTKGPQVGTGIGLFMSKTIIEKNMGGRLTVRNTDTGAEFKIEVEHGTQN